MVVMVCTRVVPDSQLGSLRTARLQHPDFENHRPYRTQGHTGRQDAEVTTLEIQ